MRLFRTAGLVVTAATVALVMAGCGSDPNTAVQPTGSATATGRATHSPSPTASPGATGTASPQPGGGTFGPACNTLPTSGPGSPQAMSTQPVATAAASNPQMTTFSAAVRTAGLTDSLNNAPALTVFAPTNAAFAKLGQANLNNLLANKQQLTQVLQFHVIGERVAPDALEGSHRTLEGADLTVTGTEPNFRVNDTANIVCGNIQTSNATVYLIDTVLMPPSSTGQPTPQES